MVAERAAPALAGSAVPGEEDPVGVDELLGRVARGDREAFAGIYRQAAAPVYGLVRAMTGDDARAAEMAAEALAEVWRSASRYSPEAGSGLSWVIDTARRYAAGCVRAARAEARGREPARLSALETSAPGAGAAGTPGPLTGPHAQVLPLALDGGYTQDEISDLLGLAPDAVARLIRDGLLQLAGK